jgi:putative hydrolase of the HAD superfamily
MKPVEHLHATETWIFDLDNTLYPASSGLMAEVSRRMTRFVAETLGVHEEEAFVEQKKLFREHGTTLRGLMNSHDIDPDDFMAYVHSVDYALVAENPRLKRAIDTLPGRKIVFTNASVAHAETVLDRLGIAHAFSGIFDVAAAGYLPKPNRQAYETLAAHHAVDPSHAVMVEDIAPNLEPAAQMGMTTVWVRHDRAADPYWATPADDAGYIHHETDDLTAWLEALLPAPHADDGKPAGR